MSEIYKEKDILHKNLIELNTASRTNNSNIIEQPNTDNLNNELLKKQKKYEKQKQTIKLLQQQIQSCNNYNHIENIKYSIYEEIASLSNQLTSLNEQNKFLINENYQLKNCIINKNKVIEEFEKLVMESKEKFKKLEQYNNELMKKLRKFQKDFEEIENKVIQRDDKQKKKNRI